MDLRVAEFNLAKRDILGITGPVLIRVFRGPTEIPQIERGRELIDELLERRPTAGLLTVAHHGATFPDAATRRYTSRTFGAYGDRLVMAQVVLGLGFWADAARATAIAIARLVGVHMPIEATLEAGASKLALELAGIEPAQLIAAHDQLFAQLQAATTGLHT